MICKTSLFEFLIRYTYNIYMRRKLYLSGSRNCKALSSRSIVQGARFVDIDPPYPSLSVCVFYCHLNLPIFCTTSLRVDVREILNVSSRVLYQNKGYLFWITNLLTDKLKIKYAWCWVRPNRPTHPLSAIRFVCFSAAICRYFVHFHGERSTRNPDRSTIIFACK